MLLLCRIQTNIALTPSMRGEVGVAGSYVAPCSGLLKLLMKLISMALLFTCIKSITSLPVDVVRKALVQ